MRSRLPLDVIFLALMILFLPSLEGPKNIFWGLFVLSWFVLRWREGGVFTGWNRWDNLILLSMFAGFLVAPFAGLDHDQWKGGKNIVVYSSLLLLLKHAHYSQSIVLFLLRTIIFSTLIATLLALWNFKIAGLTPQVQLHSVGHVNHSAIYLMISQCVAMALLFTRWSDAKGIERGLLLIISVILASAIVISSSRAALLMLGIFSLFISVAWRHHSRRPLLIFPLILTLGAGGLIVGKATVIEEQKVQMESGMVMQVRDRIWRTALLTWKEYPVFGVGPKNYSQVTEEKIREWLARDGKEYERMKFLPYAHAHNLILNTLVEQGLVGLFILISLLTYLGVQLFKGWPDKHNSPISWAIWLSATGALLSTLFIGIFNTTLHHEHGMLTMLLLGLWFMNRQSVVTNH